MNTQNCISGADLVRLWDGAVTPRQEEAIRQHLEGCPQCRKRWEEISAGAHYMESIFRDGDASPGEVVHTLQPADRTTGQITPEEEKWWKRYVMHQVLTLLVRLPEELEELLENLEVTGSVSVESAHIIRLPVLEPAESDKHRLAAATGEGFAEQFLHQEDPPFDFHVVQFGRQLRIEVEYAGEDSADKDCLARLKIFEDNIPVLSRYLLVENSKAQLILAPQEVRSLRPQEKQLAFKLEPVRELAQLASAGSEAYMPILRRLLKHEDPEIRRGTVQVLARICGPKVAPLIAPLAGDQDESVRLAVQKAMHQFPHSPDTQETGADD